MADLMEGLLSAPSVDRRRRSPQTASLSYVVAVDDTFGVGY